MRSDQSGIRKKSVRFVSEYITRERKTRAYMMKASRQRIAIFDRAKHNVQND